MSLGGSMHMVPRLYTLLSVCCLFPFVLCAQRVDVRGSVADSVTGERLPFANIVIKELARAAGTNNAGFYLVTNVPPGTYEITASFLGYEQQSRRIVVGTLGPVILNFRLKPTAIEFGEVVVTAKGRTSLNEISTSVHILDQADARLVPVAVQEDLFRAIEILPGIVSTSDVTSQFYVRGGAGDQNLILLDGIKIYNPYHAFGIFSTFDPEIIKTAEVFVGAFPAGYGGRLSSVVDITTRDGRSDRIGGRANLNFLSANLRAEGMAHIITDLTWLISGRRSLFSAPLKKFFRQDVPLSFYDAFIKVNTYSSESAKMSLLGFFNGDKLTSAGFDQPDYSWKNSSFGVRSSGLITERVYVDAVAFDTRFEAQRDAKGSRIIQGSSTSVHESGVRVNATLYTDTKDLYFFGFETSFPQLDYKLTNRFGMPLRMSDSTPEEYAWIRYQSRGKESQLDVGVHADVASLIRGEGVWEYVQPRVTLTRPLWGTWTWKASYGRINQNFITVNNEDDVIALFDAWIRAPSSVRSEVADHFVVGAEGNILPVLATRVETYFKYYGKLVAYNRDKIDALDPDYISGRGKAFGIEMLMRYTHSLLDVYASYTFGETSITNNEITYAPRYDRRHSFKLLTTLRPLKNLDIVVRWDLASGLPFTQGTGYYDRLRMVDIFDEYDPGETGAPYNRLGPKNAARLPDFHRLDAAITYRFSFNSVKGSLGVTVINAYDHRNVFYFDRKTGQQINMLPFFPSATLNLEY